MALKVTPEMVVDRVIELCSMGQAVIYSRGPMADRGAKRALGLAGPRSQFGLAIKEAVRLGKLQVADTGEVALVYSGERTRYYPVVRLEAATQS